jgi:hypothetical protein
MVRRGHNTKARGLLVSWIQNYSVDKKNEKYGGK